jgi:hypothetical protein
VPFRSRAARGVISVPCRFGQALPEKERPLYCVVSGEGRSQNVPVLCRFGRGPRPERPTYFAVSDEGRLRAAPVPCRFGHALPEKERPLYCVVSGEDRLQNVPVLKPFRTRAAPRTAHVLCRFGRRRPPDGPRALQFWTQPLLRALPFRTRAVCRAAFRLTASGTAPASYPPLAVSNHGRFQSGRFGREPLAQGATVLCRFGRKLFPRDLPFRKRVAS